MPPKGYRRAQAAAQAVKPEPSTKSVVLKIPSLRLRKWADEKDAIHTPARSKNSSANSTPPVNIKDSPPDAGNKPEASATNTPDPVAESTPQNEKETKKRGPFGPKPGVKRSAAAVEDAPAKVRAKPGPKRRKIDGPADENERPWTTPAAQIWHKLGPKANQGAINACLRALDRTGAPCKRWVRKPFNVKSFTGVVWEMPSWRTPKGSKDEENGKSENGATPTSTSENLPPASSSNVGSDAPADATLGPSSPPAAATTA